MRKKLVLAMTMVLPVVVLAACSGSLGEAGAGTSHGGTSSSSNARGAAGSSGSAASSDSAASSGSAGAPGSARNSAPTTSSGVAGAPGLESSGATMPGGSSPAASGGSSTVSPSESGAASPSESAPATPDLDNIPAVVAKVDGHKITKSAFVDAYRSQFRQAQLQAQQTGQKPDQNQLKKQVAQGLVGRQLMLDEAHHRGLTATKKQVHHELVQIAKQNGLDSAGDLIDAMAQQGTDKKEVRHRVKAQVEIEHLIVDEAGDVTPSKKDVRQYYDNAVKAQGSGNKSGKKDNTPSFKDVEPQIKQQLTEQKENQEAQKLVTKLRKKANVTVNL